MNVIWLIWPNNYSVKLVEILRQFFYQKCQCYKICVLHIFSLSLVEFPREATEATNGRNGGRIIEGENAEEEGSERSRRYDGSARTPK